MKPFQAWKTTGLASLGATFEYADFVVYLLLARYLSLAFFPISSEWATTLQSVGLFAAGFIARPLGGIFFGSRGDRDGRKSTFVKTTCLMAGATLAIGCLPTYHAIGLTAPLILIVLRCIQGFSLGGELPGAVTFVAEHASEKVRGRYCGSIGVGITLGGIIASVFLALLTKLVAEDQMQQWGWRIPFWCGGSFVLFSQTLRKRLHETPVFSKARGATAYAPISRLFREYRRSLVGCLLMALFATGLLVFPLYAPMYLTKACGYPSESVYAAISLSMFQAMLASVLGGSLCDKVGAKRQFVASALACAILLPTGLAALPGAGLPTLYAVLFVWQTAVGLTVIPYWVLLAETFPPAIRYSGLGVCLNGGFVATGLLPILFEHLLASFHHASVVMYPYAALACLGCLGALVLPQQDAAWRPSALRQTPV